MNDMKQTCTLKSLKNLQLLALYCLPGSLKAVRLLEFSMLYQLNA